MAVAVGREGVGVPGLGGRGEGAVGGIDADLVLQPVRPGDAPHRALAIAVQGREGGARAGVQIWTKWKGVTLQPLAVLH